MGCAETVFTFCTKVLHSLEARQMGGFKKMVVEPPANDCSGILDQTRLPVYTVTGEEGSIPQSARRRKGPR